MTDKQALDKAFDELELETTEMTWTPKIEKIYKDGVLISQTIQRTLNGPVEEYVEEPDEVAQWKALLENEYKQRMFLQWQLDRLIEQMLPINDDFIDDVLEDDDFEREKRMAFLQGVRWREAMYKIQ